MGRRADFSVQTRPLQYSYQLTPVHHLRIGYLPYLEKVPL